MSIEQMSIEQMSTTLLARRDRLSRERRATLLATIATLMVFAFILAAAYGGFK